MTGMPVLHYAGDGTLRRLGGPGEAVKFTVKEAEFWEALLASPGGMVSTDHLMSALYVHAAEEPFNGILKVFASNMRRKLAQLDARDALLTVWGRGYALNVLKYDFQRDESVLELDLDPAAIHAVREAAFLEQKTVQEFAAEALLRAAGLAMEGK